MSRPNHDGPHFTSPPERSTVWAARVPGRGPVEMQRAQTSATVAQTMLRFTGLMQTVLGVLLWSGRARTMLAVQMLLGFVLALALWALAVLAARAGVSAVLVIVALAWGLVVAALGPWQGPGRLASGDWLAHGAEVLAALAAIGLGEALAIRTRCHDGASVRRPDDTNQRMRHHD